MHCAGWARSSQIPQGSVESHVEEKLRQHVKPVPIEIGLRRGLLGELHASAQGHILARVPTDIAAADEDEVLAAAWIVRVIGPLDAARGRQREALDWRAPN